MPNRVETAVRRQRPARRLLRGILGAVLGGCPAILVIGGCLAGAVFLWRLALEDPRFRLEGETLGVYGALRECPESVDELAAIGRGFAGRGLLDPALIPDLEAAFARSVWVKKVVRLRRVFPNRIELEYLLRLPAAQVWSDSRYWLVDGEAVLLPVPGSPAPFPELAEIVGVTAGLIRGRPRPGETWRDEGVAGALGIIRAFWNSPLSEIVPVEKVLVTAGAFRHREREVEKRRRFEVVSRTGTVIRWGAFNPDRLGGEPTTAEKLEALKDLLGSREALLPGVSFDVRTRLPGFTIIE
ncbi:MAG: hypothetical protein LBU64_07955 [Planctomycetota bacterium]|nr:hypothetical protein [Planctomycetota bacterium]